MKLPFLLALLIAPFSAGASYRLPQVVGECDAHEMQYSCKDEKRRNESVRAYCEHRMQKQVIPASLSAEDARNLREQALADCIKLKLNEGTMSCSECALLRARAEAPAPAPSQPGPGNGAHAQPDPVKEKQEDPAGTRPEADCKSRDCLIKAAQEQREAEELSRQRRLDMERAARESQRNRNSSITTAADFLDQWGKSLERNPNATPQEQAQYQNDRRLVERAISGQPFTARDAEGARSAFVRDALELYAEAGEQEKIFQKESEKSARSEKEFQQLAQRTSVRAGSLGQASGGRAPAASYPVGSGGSPAGPGKTAAPTGRSSIAVASRDSAPGEAGKKASVFLPAGGNSSDSKDDKIGAGAGGRALASGPALRDILKRRLTEKGKGGAATQAVTGKPADLERRGSGLWAEGEEPVAGFAAQVLAEADGKRGPDYAIGAEETSRQLRQMMSDAGFEKGEEDGGLLGMDSATLFERVRQAHLSCQARDCLRQQAP